LRNRTLAGSRRAINGDNGNIISIHEIQPQ
jgi:hypothetical protein